MYPVPYRIVCAALLCLGVPRVWAVTAVPDHAVSSRGVHVVINLPQTRLFVYDDGQLVKSYPVAVGKALTQTPEGEYDVTGISRNPAWHVPRSIQQEMARAGKTVQTVVPPGPQNPLGKVFIRFGEPGLGLGMHGTNAPGSVPGFRSHGCVRLRNEDALDLASRVRYGVPVSVIYQSVLLNQDARGDVWMTAFADRYGKTTANAAQIRTAAEKWSRGGREIRQQRIIEALQARTGKPVCLSCRDSSNGQIAGLQPLPWLRPDIPVVVPDGNETGAVSPPPVAAPVENALPTFSSPAATMPAQASSVAERLF
ncbi:L,D-transpeptidase [Laribacter hongkongensis]|uniref:L,D-transpeptidase catalytic domain n=1 Tax=Laribacter hongkongensis TaxID=168471 RepID=A0A248LJR5_9NEIS|nr:L,D-transpeptidase [Laribacter hongkongensis]ASJ24606.1 L,D-transpeptidase catalytic domain [Laribacter hongkongensis]MCG9041218.1 L,D-transpeptidase [Laribacter hongkongensis]MCG9068094.1 L,D-transpeptidase [Laribacter hongkongensis]MCG9088855.1 L,D-transpeptidase [Laribacter hongkongensis]MCG9109830.1 L,D-transpeptidase [Laribacter hongkongensis]